MRSQLTCILLTLALFGGTTALAREKNDEVEGAARAVADRGVAASAAEIPALAKLLEKAGWTPTPELSGVFKPGSIFEQTALGHRSLADSCIAAPPRENTYTAAEVVTSLQAGVSVGGPLVGGGGYAGIIKKVKFGTPTQVTIPLLDLELSQSCTEKLSRLPTSRIQSAYVVQEVLKAEISEQTCGKVDARGSFVGLGAAEGEYAAACAQASLEPVAVGYRTMPLADLLHLKIDASEPAKRDGATGGSSVNGGGFDTSATLARIQAAKDEETDLNAELEACLDKEEQKLIAQSKADAANLAPLLKETSAKAKELGSADVKRYLDLYGSAAVICKNELGGRRRAVSVSSLDEMRRWLEAPASGGAVAGGTWTGPSGYTMMAVPAGTYEVGCTASKSGCGSDEKPAHPVKLSRGVLMGQTEVTQGLWQSVMGSNPSHFKGCGLTCPVEQVSWVDAAKFANALSKKDGLEACYTISGDSVSWPRGLGCTGYRLPTEAEWEVAARGGRDSPYAGGSEVELVGWTRENSGRTTHPVGEKAANGYGLYDMTGNVWEWTWDWYGDYSRGVQVDPVGAGSGSNRVFRGGSWYISAAYARVANRNLGGPAVRSNFHGFRLARSDRP
jgi:formylglycine-generating enzyme required for sulfatase activity